MTDGHFVFAWLAIASAFLCGECKIGYRRFCYADAFLERVLVLMV